MRMKENYDRTGDNSAAISEGLEKTARLITGAAAIMMAVFIAFAAAPIATVSQLGIGLTVAVLLDATMIRIVLLLALMLLLGDRVWHVPKWLDRILPELDVEGEGDGHGRPGKVVVGGVADEPSRG
jgi:RND superfamily putative drug exporter